MKATELRIGNWVQDRHSEECGMIDIVVLGIIDAMENHSYEPIPLTEEWLVKFGFKNKSNSGSAYYLLFSGDYGLGLQEGLTQETRGMYYYFMTNSDRSIKIEYVHQLQNLYFALTGQELQTDETKKKVK